jgi:putative glutamine amidotransferase
MTSDAPIIGLTGRRKPGSDIAGLPGVLNTLDLDLYFGHYTRAVVAAGGLPVLLSLDTPVDVVERLDGILISGGADVHPDAYGQPLAPELTSLEPARDAYEFAILEAAYAAEVPVLGICRGLQIINVHHGGTIHQHVPDHGRHDLPIDHLLHDVAFAPGSIAAGIYGPQIAVNSLHHQTIDEVGDGLLVVGRCVGGPDDNAIEAIEVDGVEALAVQWHPEMLNSPDPAFEWLTERAAARTV